MDDGAGAGWENRRALALSSRLLLAAPEGVNAKCHLLYFISSIEAALTLAAEQCQILISSAFPARGEAREGGELILFCIIFNLNSISFLFFL